MNKIIGTAVPLSALWSRRQDLLSEDGTTAVGIAFIDWLHKTGQSGWLLLPLSETHLEPGSTKVHVPSPYKGYGVGLNPAYLPSSMKDLCPTPAEERRFRKENAGWIDDYALFCALRDHFGTDDWRQWDRDIRGRKPKAIKSWSERLESSVKQHLYTQWRLDNAFRGLRERAKTSGVLLFGDLPFYIPFRSPLVWANPDCFDLRADGGMNRVSGLPDGPRAHYGRQVWGHPLYRWGNTQDNSRIFGLWKMRLRYFAGFYDMMRLDHAKGFFHYGSMGVRKRSKDRLLEGPGAKMLERIIAYSRKRGLELFAEDSGDRLKELRETLWKLNVPGIRILRWAYNEKRKSLEHDYSDVRNYPEDAFALSHTHDTVTLTTYVKSLTAAERRHLAEHVGVAYTRKTRLFVMRLIGALIASPARRVIIPIQDWLFSENRINVPGTEKPVGDPNWRYRTEVPIEKLPDVGGAPKFD
ncbi:hypothetical protein AMJ57_03005 [Parcubacteria bacterium SG8_24]|nr:MAG: hypothetical protein AMJ57_03005 [Parcubacteria bacterium SG8_24]